jgi:hypothetical protein
MKPNRPLGLALLLTGAILLIYGIAEMVAFFVRFRK